MIVEFVGGSLDGQQRNIDRFYEYINDGNDVYYAHAVRYEKLGWVYVWYKYHGKLEEPIYQ